MKKNIRSMVFVLADIVSFNIALLLAYYIRYDFSFNSIYQNFIANLPMLCLATTVTKVLIFTAFKLYKSLWRYAGAYEVINVVIASAVANTVLTAFLILQYDFTGVVYAPRSIFALTFMLDVFAVGGVRFLYRIYRRLVIGSTVDLDKVKRVLIVGAGDAGAIIAKEIKNHPDMHLKLVAFYDIDVYKVGFKINGIPVLGNNEKLENVIHKERISEVIIALPHAKTSVLNKVYADSAKAGCSVKILPSMVQIIDESVVMQKVKDVDIEDLLGRDLVNLDANEIEQFLTNKVILVTGAGGSIGSELSRQICYFRPSKLLLLDNYENSLHDVVLELRNKYPNVLIEPLVANIRDGNRIFDIFRKSQPNIVFHAAAHKHVPLMEWHPVEALKNNVLGTWNVAEAAHKTRVNRFVLISSDKAVNPTNVMGATKRIAEMIIQSLNALSSTEFVAVRFGNVLGSNGSVIPIFKRQIESGGPVTVTHPDMTRFFMAIPEAAQLVIQAGAYAKGGEIFILDMGQPVKILELAENMIRLSGFEPYEDIPIKFSGLRPGEKLFEELLLSEEGIEKTKNDKIYVAKPFFGDYQFIENEINYLKEYLYKDNSDDFPVRDYIKKLVPTYNDSNEKV